MSDLRYLVRKRGREHAAFVYPSDAKEYIEADVARNYVTRNGEQHAVYPVEDYTIEEIKSGRKVVAVTGHGHAIMEKLKAAGR